MTCECVNPKHVCGTNCKYYARDGHCRCCGVIQSEDGRCVYDRYCERCPKAGIDAYGESPTCNSCGADLTNSPRLEELK